MAAMTKKALAEALAQAETLNNAFDRLEAKVAALVKFVTGRANG